MNQTILILSAGGKDAHIIAKALRELNVYCEIRSAKTAKKAIRELKPAGVILAQGASSEQVLDAVGKRKCVALSAQDCQQQIKDFAAQCGCKGEWTMEAYAQDSIEKIRAEVGEGKVLLALSGGVDSSVCAALLSKAIGKKLICLFVDTGLMRKNEGDEVEQAFADWELNFIRVNAEQRFLDKLKGVKDPEKKRKIIGTEFIRVFEEEAAKIGEVDFLAQGTIYPDVIESGKDGSKNVKSHHNVGGLPKVIKFKSLIEPLRFLFKGEVRRLGEVLGLTPLLYERQPFPGPGLAVRVIGDITKDKLDTLRDADHIFRSEIANAQLCHTISQYFAILTPMMSVGVRNEERVYERTVALRGIVTSDFMSGSFAHIPYEVLERASQRIVSEVKGVNRVVYDITSKPPATIEWE